MKPDTTAAAGSNRHPASQVLAVLAVLAATLSLVLALAPSRAAADRAGSYAGDEVNLWCEGASADGVRASFGVQTTPDGTVNYSFLDLLDENWEHAAVATATSAVLSNGVLALEFDLAAVDGSSLGAASIRGSFTIGETVAVRDRFREGGSVWHVADDRTPYFVTIDAADLGPFAIEGITCEAGRSVEARHWSEPHRIVFEGVQVAAEGLEAPGMTDVGLGVVTGGVELSFDLDDRHGLMLLEGDGRLAGSTAWWTEEGDFLGWTDATGSLVQSGPVVRGADATKTSNTVYRTTPYDFSYQLGTLDGGPLAGGSDVAVSQVRVVTEVGGE